MISLKDILTEQEIQEYHEGWGSFPNKQKYKPETEYHVHSGMPVIGKVFRYKDKPLFRAHVFQKKLRKFDPYFIAEKYIHPFWHALHYFVVMEQMYHAASNLIRDNSKLVGKDIPENFKWKKSIFWGNEKSISTELILEMFGKKGVI